jgi:hypothetical protein
MKPLFVTFQLLTMSILLTVVSTAGAGETAPANQQEGTLPQSHLSTDIHFGDMMVRGRHQSPLGLTSAVESEKNTPKLIDYRTDFSDRVARSKSGR